MTPPVQPILLLADAGARVGGGHVMRCLTLAGALEAAGARCAFMAPPAVGPILDVFAPVGTGRVAVEEADPEALVQAAIAAARLSPPAWIVVDHYGLDSVQERALATVAGRLLAMDDLKRRHAADLVLDSNPGRVAADYPGLESLTGPGFTLVRPRFAALRPAALKRRRAAVRVERVLVSLGLTDVGAITGRVVAAILPVLGERVLDVVAGRAAPSLEALREQAAGDARISLHVDTLDMAGLMAAADLAIGAGGSSTWERCCLGLPSLTLVLADNQRDSARVLADRGACLSLDATVGGFEPDLAEAFRRLAGDRRLRDSLSAASASLCDGLGAERVARRMLELGV